MLVQQIGLPMEISLNQANLQPILLTAAEIFLNPQNNSTAKQQYSFQKSERFEQPRTSISNYNYYDLPSTNSKKAPVMGREQRKVFEESKGISPGPNRYSKAREGDIGYFGPLSKNRGCYMGLGRSEVKVHNFLGQSREGAEVIYETDSSLKRSRREYTFSKERRKFMSEKKDEFSNIGPGSYRIKTSLQQDKQFLSNQPKSLFPKIHQPSKNTHRKEPAHERPFYEPKMTFKGDSLQIQNHNKGFKIGLSKRSRIIRTEESPGPGHNLFSQFLSKGKANS